MKPNLLLGVTSLALGLLIGMPARAASLAQINRSDWTGGVTLPSYVQMYIYVPDKVATNPPIIVSAHACGSSASGQLGNTPSIKAAADKNGFIMVLPDNPGQNCWDVGSAQSLKHDGGGDTQAVAQMVKYTLAKYSGDASRVYVMGGSSGGMMTQAMVAVYPDIFRAGAARAGVPAGCWADGYSASNQWSNNCAGGNTTKTAQQWGDLVRSMFSTYSGHRPRVQLMQGEADETISYKNTGEAIKEWTNVLGLSTTPTSTDTGYKGTAATWDRQFWSNACGYTVLEAWSAPGGTHSMNYEEPAILKFFGLDVASGADPEPECNGDGGVPGTGGISGSGGSTATAGTGGDRDGGADARDGGRDLATGTGGAGGAAGTGGGASSGGIAGSGGASGTSGETGSGGSVGSGGRTGSTDSGGSGDSGGSVLGGAPASGGMGGSGGSGSGGSVGTGGSSGGGCSCALGGRRPGAMVAALLLVGLGLLRPRRPTRR